jgi:hypothetical protein
MIYLDFNLEILQHITETFGGLVVSMLASGTQYRGFAPGQSRQIFVRKNPQHAFLRKGRKSRLPHVADLRHVKYP